jgi:hypothetical protein
MGKSGLMIGREAGLGMRRRLKRVPAKCDAPTDRIFGFGYQENTDAPPRGPAVTSSLRSIGSDRTPAGRPRLETPHCALRLCRFRLSAEPSVVKQLRRALAPAALDLFDPGNMKRRCQGELSLVLAFPNNETSAAGNEQVIRMMNRQPTAVTEAKRKRLERMCRQQLTQHRDGVHRPKGDRKSVNFQPTLA